MFVLNGLYAVKKLLGKDALRDWLFVDWVLALLKL
jgi:hypothetical protein